MVVEDLLRTKASNMRIVAFSGPKYCGKDTAAKALLTLQENVTHNIFRRAPMAEGVKNICREVFGYTDEHLEDPVLKETKTDFYPFIEPRWPMMDIANWMRDQYGGDVWAKRWERVALECDEYWACHVMTDLRFPEELEMLKRLGALIVYIHRTEAEEALAAKKNAGNAMALNPSEAHYDLIRENADVTIYNDGEIHQLNNQVHAVVRNYYGHWSQWGAEKSVLQKMRTGEFDAE